MVHTPFIPSGYWSPSAPLVWNHGFPTPLGGLSMSTNLVKELDICFSFSQFRKQHLRHEEAVSRTSLAEAIYAWPCESISRGRTNSLHSRPYQGVWSPCAPLIWNPVKAPDIRFSSSHFRKQHRHEKAVSRTSLAEATYA
ncbi:unnamed protein product [Schistosoma margrebowiei]|uniref:Uncharacterized protein n=1 Tax=Schistosoma margrebowiei TaxID=48269 RepID=A0A3P8C4B9_9TREM|nr:unnamed protein product [Schistosoma margrebowiei]